MAVKITIPSEHYVGLRKQRDDVPLAFITPNGTDKAALNRISTVDSWTRGQDQLDSTVMKNIPLYGFKLTCDIRRAGSYGSGDKWYIEDPRGFQLEINSTNLAYLIEHCVIENGTILDSCIWARQSGTNVLLATSTELYKTAENFTSLSQTSESIKNVKIGNTVALQNGIIGVYLGKYHLLKKAWWVSEFFEWHTPQHIIASFDDKNKLTALSTFANPKISMITDKSETTIEEAELKLNTKLLNKKKLIDCYFPVIFAVSKKSKDLNVKLIEVEDENKALTSSADTIHIVKLVSGEVGIFNAYSVSPNFEMTLLDENEITQGRMIYKINPKSHNKKYYSNDRCPIFFKESDIIGVYNVQVICKTKLGNDIVRQL